MTERSFAAGDEAEGRQDTVREEMEVRGYELGAARCV